MKQTLYTKFLFAFISVVLVTLLSVSAPLLLWVRADRTDALTQELLVQAKDLSYLLGQWKSAETSSFIYRVNGTEQYARDAFYRWVRQVSVDYGSDIIILNRFGEIDSIFVDGVIEKPSEGETYDAIMYEYFIEMQSEGDIVRRFRNDPPAIISRVKTAERKQPVLVTGTLATSNSGGLLGAVIVETAINSFDKSFIVIARQITTMSLLSLCLACIMASLLTLRFTRPLVEISQAADALAKGEFDRRVSLRRDDEIGRLAMSFNRMATDLGNLEEMRRAFIANVTHELRSPLTSIQGFVEGILDGTIAADDYEQYLGIVKNESARMGRLITELLELSRMESGQMKLNLTTFDLNEVISRALITFENRIESKRLMVEVIYKQEPLTVTADEARIEQVMINLIDNAVKFLPDEGELKIWTHSAQGKAYVTVSDNGPGISPDDMPFLFDRFYTADKAHTSGKGTGLGLSIVRGILQQHGQDITVQSRPEQGASFAFTLLLAAQNRAIT